MARRKKSRNGKSSTKSSRKSLRKSLPTLPKLPKLPTLRKPSILKTRRAKTAKATQRTSTKFGKLIDSFKKPGKRLRKTAGKSKGLFDQLSKKVIPKPRIGKILGNVPAKFSGIKLPGFRVKAPKLPGFTFPKLPKVKIPKRPDPIGFIKGLDLKSKIPKLGFPKIKLPDVGGFFKGKLKDITDSVGNIFEGAVGAAGEWDAKRKRKSLIFKVVVGLIIIFLGMLLWKKK